MNNGILKLSKILRIDEKVLLNLSRRLEEISGKKEVLEKIALENSQLVEETLHLLKLKKETKAELVEGVLLDKLKESDQILFELFRRPDGTTEEGLKSLFGFAYELANVDHGMFLKREKAEEILIQSPPPNILKALNYKDVRTLLLKEDLFEIFAALRFLENKEWMHQTFSKAYSKIKPQDFEFQKIKVKVLAGKWLKLAEKFVQKKYHNVSHLKELGVIFVIPLKIDTPGETLRVFSLILHYLHEVKFYSDLFQKFFGSENFGEKLISFLRGDVLEKVPPAKNGEINWLIIQRYLAKDDENDSRLAVPHISPEALHWKKAGNDIHRFGHRYEFTHLEMWRDLDWVGDFFPASPSASLGGQSENGLETLVSFDLIDTTMSLVKEQELIKYLYHHQEALWNKIFTEYLGHDKLEELIIENFYKGYINL